MDLRLRAKKVLVLGLGISGRSAVRYLIAKGCEVYAFDDCWEVLQHQEQIKELCSQGLQISSDLCTIELLVVSPGIPRTHPLYSAASKRGIKIVGEAELALGALPKGSKCVGITGTNGKTTVTFLIEHILNACGIPAKAFGNSGIPLTSLFTENKSLEEMVIVAEISSFQLETLHSRVFDAAVLLNITDDHLDRYASFLEYAQAKMHLFDCIKENGKCFIENRCYQAYSALFPMEVSKQTYGLDPSADLYSDGSFILTPDLKIPLTEIDLIKSNHDLENVLAAFAIAAEFAGPEKIIASLASFKKPPHRLEFVRKFQGITFIDDSKATNVDAVVRAVESISTPIVLIAGGVDKGGSYRSWREAFKGKVKAICTIGEAAEKIQGELEQEFPIHFFKEFQEAVCHAAKMAYPNETVLLSPGCASYDMFSSYAHRGRVFKEIVYALDKDHS